MKKYTRAEVTPEFQQAVKAIARARIEQFAKEIRIARPWAVEMIRKKKAPIVAKLASLRDPDKMDFEVTRLRSLPYEVFDVVEFHKREYLHGKTAEIVMVQWSTDKPPKADARKWNMGKYDVYFPLDDLLYGSYSNAHFIPVREPNTHYRHPHHKGYAQSAEDDPLHFSPSTCWGSYGAIVSDCAVNGDVTELFRAIHSYLSRYNVRSPLGGGVEYCNFAQEVH